MLDVCPGSRAPRVVYRSRGPPLCSDTRSRTADARPSVSTVESGSRLRPSYAPTRVLSTRASGYSCVNCVVVRSRKEDISRRTCARTQASDLMHVGCVLAGSPVVTRSQCTCGNTRARGRSGARAAGGRMRTARACGVMRDTAGRWRLGGWRDVRRGKREVNDSGGD